MNTKPTKNEDDDFQEAKFVDRIQINLNEEQERKLTLWIDRRKNAIETARTDFIQRQKKYLYNYDDFITYVRKGPWDGSSNFHSPLTLIMTKAMHSRLYNIFSNEDTTQILPREGYDEELVKVLKKLREWYLWDYLNGYKGIKGVTDEVMFDVASTGMGIALKSWDVQQRKFLQLVPNELRREVNDLEGEIEEAKKEERKVQVKPYKEIQKILTIFEGSKIVSVPFENAYFPNFIPETSDMDYPKMVLLSTEMSVSEIMMKGLQKEWDSEKCEKVKSEGLGKNMYADDVNRRRQQLTGYNDEMEKSNEEVRNIEFCFVTYDIDDDGLDEEIVVTRSSKGTILRTTFLDRISPSGKRPVFKFDCFKKPRQAYSRGVPEFMYSIQEKLDLDYNMRSDYLQLQTCPWGTYRSSSSLKNEPIRIAPGKFIPVDETNDLKPFTFNSNALALRGEEELLWHWAERQISISSLSQGIVPNVVGPTRSTSGVIALLKEMDKEFKPLIEHNARQWRKLEQALIEDLDYRVDPRIKIKVLGASIENIIDPKELDQIEALNRAILVSGALDFRIDVASIINSEEIRRNEATIILDKLAAPSLLQQFGVVTPKTLFMAASEYLKAFGKDVPQWLNQPQFIDKALTLFQEVQVAGQGEIPPMAMQDEHEEKANGLIEFMKTPEYQEAKAKGLYIQSADEWMMKTIRKHQVLTQMLKPKGLPNESGQNNAPAHELMSGTAPQQGGQDFRNTTSRDLAEPSKQPVEEQPNG